MAEVRQALLILSRVVQNDYGGANSRRFQLGMEVAQVRAQDRGTGKYEPRSTCLGMQVRVYILEGTAVTRLFELNKQVKSRQVV